MNKRFAGSLGVIGFFLTLSLIAPSALAHDPGLSEAQLVLQPDEMWIDLTLADGDFRRLSAGSSAGYFAVNERLATLVDTRLAPPDGVVLKFRTPLMGGDKLSVAAPFVAALPRGHRLHVTVSDATGKVLTRDFLSTGTLDLETEPRDTEARPTPVQVFGDFVVEGVWHILIGLDHLAFLALLLLPLAGRAGATGQWRRLVGVVTGFTVGHSLTLSLAALDLVRVPAGPVEAGIAATIVVAGVLNLRGGNERIGAWIALPFGLVHGLGFAGVLGELGLPPDEKVLGLFAFNVGVELGQLAVVLVSWPLLRLLLNSRHGGLLVPAGSVGFAAVGAVWLVERLGG